MKEEFYSQVQLSKETGISRSTIRDYIRDYADFIELQTGFKNGFIAYNDTAKEILLHIREMHQRGLTISVIKELLAEKYPMQISETVSTEPNTSKVALRDRVPPGLVSKQEHDILSARYDELSVRVVALVERMESIEQENKELKLALSNTSNNIGQVKENLTKVVSSVDHLQESFANEAQRVTELERNKRTFEEFMEEYRIRQQEQKKIPWWKKIFG